MYAPSKKPRARDLAKLATIHDSQAFSKAIRERWTKASRNPRVVASFLEDIGVMHAVEVQGDLRVRGNFDVGKHGIAALYVHGDLVVDGAYSDPSDPQTVVIIGGDLRARAIVTGAHLEVHGDVKARHIAGDYNDYSATFLGSVEATTFFPENHHFELAKPPHFELVLGDDAHYRVPRRIQRFIKTIPNGALHAYLRKGFVDGGDIDSQRLYAALRSRKDILTAEPSSVVPELAIFSPTVRAKLATPEKVTSVSLTNRELTALPAPLVACTNLTSLDLEDNELRDLRGIGKFRKLRKLNLDSNTMRSLPTEMRALEELRSLSLRYTKNLHTFPRWFGELAHLEELNITLSALEKFPRELIALPALRKLSIWHWFDVSPKLMTETVEAIGAMKLTHLAFLQGGIPALPRDLSPLEKVGVIKIWDLGLTREEKARVAAALPRAQIDPKNILL